MGVDLFSDLQPRITKDDEEATNNIIPWLDNLSKTTLMGPVPKYIVFKVKLVQVPENIEILTVQVRGFTEIIIVKQSNASLNTKNKTKYNIITKQNKTKPLTPKTQKYKNAKKQIQK